MRLGTVKTGISWRQIRTAASFSALVLNILANVKLAKFVLSSRHMRNQQRHVEHYL